MTALLSREFIRYFWAGCLTFGADLSVLIGLTELAGFHYLVANLFSFLAGLTVNYLLCIRWVFACRRLAVAKQEFTIFTLLAIVGLIINEGLMWVVVELVGAHYSVAKVVVAGAVFGINFGLKKVVLFR